MVSYRDGLSNIHIFPPGPVSYAGFYSRPSSLRQAIAAMQAPAPESWSQAPELPPADEFWTDEVQGVCWDGANWIFSCNARQNKPGARDKALYTFAGGAKLADDHWKSVLNYKDVPHPVAGKESDDHWGQLTFFNGFVYVSHFWEGGPLQGAKKGGANVVVFRDHDGVLEFVNWIALDQPTSPTTGLQTTAEFQGINPWDGMLYTCFGGGDINEFFLHDPNTGDFTGGTLKFDVPVTQVQGACFSPNGHLYIASNARIDQQGQFQTIAYYSALNGVRLGVIPVPALDFLPLIDDHELEGLCLANVSAADGTPLQLHAILLENRGAALDNFYFKSFSCTQAALV